MTEQTDLDAEIKPEDVEVEEVDANRDYYMLTTTDNPFNPFTQWNAWYAWDVQNLNACSFLSRLTVSSYDLSYNDQVDAVQEAIEEIVRNDPTGMYKKVLPSDYK